MRMRKSKKKGSPLDRYARAIQDDIAALGAKMDAGFKNVEARFKGVDHQMGEIRDDVKRLNEIMVSKADLAETIRRELDASPFAKESEVEAIRDRLATVEQKLGIKANRRAA